MMNGFLGGLLIGAAASLFLLLFGRISGVSGMIASSLLVLKGSWQERSLKLFFLLGLVLGGFFLRFYSPQSFQLESSAHLIDYAIAGALVGFGTLWGNGCTSGHGVCGLSRLSIRSLYSTLTFIFFGILSVILFRFIRGEL